MIINSVATTDAMFLSGPPSVGDQSARLYEQLAPDYQRLSAVRTVTGRSQRTFVLSGLQPGTLYAVVIAPFADDLDGAASNTVYLQTSDDGQLPLLTSTAAADRRVSFIADIQGGSKLDTVGVWRWWV